jgi:hypothetical protein
MRTSLKDLLGPLAEAPSITKAWQGVPGDEELKGYATHMRRTSSSRFDAQFVLAKAIAAEMLANDGNIRAVESRLGVGCQTSVGMPWAGCGETFVAALSSRLKRRPADAVERARLKSVFDQSMARKSDARLAWRGVVQGLVVSFEALHVTESVAASGRFDARNVGTRLSLAVAGVLPDAPLLADMASGAILDPAKREEHARRLLASPSAEAAFGRFAQEWLNVPFNPLSVDGFPGDANGEDATYRAAVAEDLGTAASHPVFKGAGRFSDLLSTGASLPNHRWLATAYGVPQSASPVELPGEQRASLLSRVAFLSGTDGDRNLPHRGILVLGRLLCTDLGSPPGDAGAVAASIKTDGLPHREMWNVKTAGPSCMGCHRILNPVGALFDEFDGWGRHEPFETIRKSGEPPRQVPWNTASKVPLPDGSSVSVADHVEFARALSSNEVAKACFAVNWIDSAFAFENNSNCMLKSAMDSLVEDKPGSVKEMIVRVVASPEFVAR